MNDTIAKLSTAALIVLLTITVAVLYITSQPKAGSTEVTAEFEDAYPLLEGMNVREFGAVAGSISNIELSDRGTVLIKMALNQGTEPAGAAATAAIRQEDITGDSYLALDPGKDPEPLGDKVIPTSRTLNAPRFDDLLNSLDKPVREGLRLTLIELGMALERRGADLNEAALSLRPALAATNRALLEVRSQNASLKTLIRDAESVTGQAAGHTASLAKLVDGLAAAGTEAANHLPGLDSGLERAPETVSRGRVTLAKLADALNRARPLAETLNRAAPDLARSAILTPPFLDDISAALNKGKPTLQLTARLLRASLPTLAASPKRVFTAPFDLTAAVGGLLNSLIGQPKLIPALFGADADGDTSSSLFGNDVGLGSLAVERGNQSGYPNNDPERRFLRAVAVPTCETFGVPIAPGCLLDVIANNMKAPARGARRGRSESGRGAGSGGGSGSGGRGAQGEGSGGSGLGGSLNDTLNRITDRLGLPRGNGGGSGGNGHGNGGKGLDDLLDLVLGG